MRMMIPEKPYQEKVRAGPSQPTSSDNFLEKRIMSRVGFTRLQYRVERHMAHFSASWVSL